MAFIAYMSEVLTFTSGLTQGKRVELHRRQRIMDLGEVTCNLTGKGLTANIFIIVKTSSLHLNIYDDEEDGKRFSRKIWEKVQSCEMIRVTKNHTGKEKKELM